MRISKPVARALQLFRRMPRPPAKAEPVLGQMLGNPTARALLIAPAAGERGYEHDLPLVDPPSVVLTTLMERQGILVENEFLSIACSRWGMKPNRASTEDVREFVLACGKEQLFKLYVCVGSVAFSHIFGGGRKTSMKTLAGSVLHLRELPQARLFVLPDPEPLAPTFIGNQRQDAFLARVQEETQDAFRRHLLKLKGLL